jgi:hypothetical protein
MEQEQLSRDTSSWKDVRREMIREIKPAAKRATFSHPQKKPLMQRRHMRRRASAARTEAILAQRELLRGVLRPGTSGKLRDREHNGQRAVVCTPTRSSGLLVRVVSDGKDRGEKIEVSPRQFVPTGRRFIAPPPPRGFNRKKETDCTIRRARRRVSKIKVSVR